MTTTTMPRFSQPLLGLSNPPLYSSSTLMCHAFFGNQRQHKLQVSLNGTKLHRSSFNGTKLPFPSRIPQPRRSGQDLVVSASRNNGSLGGGLFDRLLAAVGYFLPLLDGMQYGRYLFAQFPATELLFRPLFPILRLYSSIPYSNFVIFFTIYLAIVRNPRFGRYIRFNNMQACVLDVLIVIPLIIQRILSPRSGFGLDLLILSYNVIFVGLISAVAFAVVSCLLGKTPRLPLVADAADNQLF